MSNECNCNASNESWAREIVTWSVRVGEFKNVRFYEFLKTEKVFAVRQLKGREFQTDVAAWLKALFAISVLTGGWFRKCLSDERNTLIGNLSATMDLKCSGWPVSRILNCHVCGNFELDPVADGKPVEWGSAWYGRSSSIELDTNFQNHSKKEHDLFSRTIIMELLTWKY